MALKNIAVFGATGNIGAAIVQGLVQRKKDFTSITALTANDPSSPKFADLKKNGVNVIKCDLHDRASLVSALKGCDAAIIALAGEIESEQVNIIEAAIEAGVKRVYPSEFGFEYSLPPNHLEVVMGKLELQKYLEQKAQEGKISYTLLVNGAFLDWGLMTGFLGFDVKNKTAMLVGQGKDKLAFTNTGDVGRFVASTLVHSEQSKNKIVRVAAFEASMADVLAALEKQMNTKFTVTNLSYEQFDNEMEEHKKKGEMHLYYMKQFFQMTFHGNGSFSPLDNSSYPEVTNLCTLEETARGVAEGKYDSFARP